MSKYTPSPWNFRRHEEWSPYFGNISGSYGKNDNGTENIRTITCQLKNGSEEENLANAALISAAPELLEALKLARKSLWLRKHVEYVDLVIKKAEGGVK